MKKILVLTGSPRKNGNSSMMADAFIKGAEKNGNEVIRFDAGFMKLSGCTACNTCWSTDTACTVKDDFNKIEPYLESCDAIVFSIPLYWFSFPAQVKCIIDRLYAYGGSGGPRPMTIKESALMIVSEDTNPEQFKSLYAMYDGMCSFLHWDVKSILTAGGVGNPGDIQNTEFLATAEELGEKF